MMLEFKSIDHLLQEHVSGGTSPGHTPLPSNITFRQTGSFDAVRRNDLFLQDDSFNRGIIDRIDSSILASRGLPVGVVEMSDVYVLRPSGIIVDPINKCCWRGLLFNWSNSAFGGSLARDLDADRNSEMLKLPPALLRRSSECENAIMVAASGYGVYGHWLLDYLPRMHRLSHDDFARNVALMRPPRPWATDLARLFEPQCTFDEVRDGAALIKVRKLLVPTTARAYGILEENSVRAAWARLDETLAGMPLTGIATGPFRRIFVSRKKLRRRSRADRSIKNIALIEQRARRAGFELVYPETLSFAEQRALFSHADVIVGEDGSGLHNMIFSKPGARIGVLSMERLNTLHAMIANAQGQRITYIPATRVLDRNGVPMAAQLRPRDFDKGLEILLS
jgi:Glycosyltransferase 61